MPRAQTGYSGHLATISKEESIRAYYLTLRGAWGRQHWWPAASRFEVIVGAYLTQNTAWTNVEKALRRLRAARKLSIRAIREIPVPELETLIRSAGYFRQKAARLKTFTAFLDETYAGSMTRMFAQPTQRLREQLLALNGVGPETADSILLYAGQHSIFVVDAYTRRILDRHRIVSAKATYDDIRELVEISLQRRLSSISQSESTYTAPAGTAHRPSRMSLAKRSSLAQTYNEMHSLMVGVGKHFCVKSKPRCEVCPLQRFLPK
jgi:endonuclease-3 related protein